MMNIFFKGTRINVWDEDQMFQMFELQLVSQSPISC